MTKTDLQNIERVRALMRELNVSTYDLRAFDLYEDAVGTVDDWRKNGNDRSFSDALDMFCENAKENAADEFEGVAQGAEEIEKLTRE